MKQLTAILLSMVLAAMVSNPPDRTGHLLRLLQDENSPHVMVVAHRGDQFGAPENSLAGFENCARWGVDILEIDLRRTSDGHWVVIHDRTLERTTTGQGPVDSHTLEEIQRLRLRDRDGRPTEHRVPTLAEVLELARGRTLVYLDKTEDHIDAVHAEVERLRATDYVLYYGRKPLAELQERYGALLDRITYLPKAGEGTGDLRKYLDQFAARRPLAFILDFRDEQSPVLAEVQRMRRAGARIWASPLWPNYAGGRTDEAALVDPDANWGWLLDQGVSMICTDRPKELIDFLRQRGRRVDLPATWASRAAENKP
jgi:glycerophosphoryl diester phosphodiesterase